MANPVPEGTHTVTPHLVFRGTAARAIDFYKKALGAVELVRMPGPDGKSLGHAEIRIGDSPVYLADEWPGGGAKSPQSLKGTTVTIHLYVGDCDGLFNRAVAAGATVAMPLMDAFWGDRYGQVVDPFGHRWSIATHKEDLTGEEMGKRAEEYMASMPPPAPPRKKAPARKTAAKAKAKGRKAKGKKRR